MREFCKFSVQFWTGALHEKLKALGPDAVLLAVYLQTNPHSNMLGTYYLPLEYMSYDTGIPLETIDRLLFEFEALNYSHFSREHTLIWVVDLAFIQTSGALKERDKRVVLMQRHYEALPMVSFLQAIYDKYHLLYHFKGKPNEKIRTGNPFNGALMEQPSKYKEKYKYKNKMKNKEKEKEKEKEKKNNTIVESLETPDPIVDIFEHWKQTMGHPHARLDKKRKQLINHALEAGYNTEEVCKAITGCSYTAYNMGDNDRGQRYDGLHVILRDADQIDRFIHNYTSPPRKLSQQEQQLRQNIDALQTWMQGEDVTYGNA